MAIWKVTLFGKINVERDTEPIGGMKARTVQELFSYLLLFKGRHQPRETISEILWGNLSINESRKKLRQTVWRLRLALGVKGNLTCPKIQGNHEWLQIDLPPDFWLDIAEFEQIFNALHYRGVKELSAKDFKLMRSGVDLYKGDLLAGWDQDWCIFERERFQVMHLALLDKLVQYCELHQNYELGIHYGTELLRFDHAYERTHRQLMRLYMLTGNRTLALHQYDHCVNALRDELGVEPSATTNELYEKIRLDMFKPSLVSDEQMITKIPLKTALVLRGLLNDLNKISARINVLEHQIHSEIAALGSTLADRL